MEVTKEMTVLCHIYRFSFLSPNGSQNRNVGWLGALKDPQIGQALALIQHQPDEQWTVGSLACRVSLSRSAFSAKFRQLVGEPPMQKVEQEFGSVLLPLLVISQ